MNTPCSSPRYRFGSRPLLVAGVAIGASLALVSTASAGVIPVDSGWNLDNVTVQLDGDGSSFDPTTGDYNFGPDSDYSYQALIDNGAGEVMGIVLAKDWPVGEPPGIKIVNDDFEVRQEGRPTNCIMSTSYLEDHFLDSDDPQQVPCSGPFQSHKRFKVAMLPTTVDSGLGAEEGIDLVFNVDPEAGSRDYQVFQKINNWTDGRLDGFTIEVGTGLGDGFVPASAGVGVDKLSLSVPTDFFRENQVATFSQGLFGPLDTQHDRPPGFFDPNTRAGFNITEYGQGSGVTDTLTSGAPLGSAYGSLFGPWLSNRTLPTGIFWDDDGNPDTDAQLVAWYGASGWKKGAADGFASIDDATIAAWGQNLEYSAGEIDDLVNVGLNYIVTVGDTMAEGSFDSFTVRVTPSVDDSAAGDPAFEGVPVNPPLVFGSSDGVVSITPAPTFPVDGLLTARIGDADLDLDPTAIDEVDVSITVDDGDPEVMTLVELGVDRGVFAATLPDEYATLPVGSVVTATYVDAADGLGGIDVVKTASTTGVDEEAPSASVSITDFSVPESMFVGQTRKLAVTVVNDADAEPVEVGEIVIRANGEEVYRELFNALEPRRKVKVSTRWTAEEVGDVEWSVTVAINGEVVDVQTDGTTVSVRANRNNGKT